MRTVIYAPAAVSIRDLIVSFLDWIFDLTSRVLRYPLCCLKDYLGITQPFNFVKHLYSKLIILSCRYPILKPLLWFNNLMIRIAAACYILFTIPFKVLDSLKIRFQEFLQCIPYVGEWLACHIGLIGITFTFILMAIVATVFFWLGIGIGLLPFIIENVIRFTIGLVITTILGFIFGGLFLLNLLLIADTVLLASGAGALGSIITLLVGWIPFIGWGITIFFAIVSLIATPVVLGIIGVLTFFAILSLAALVGTLVFWAVTGL